MTTILVETANITEAQAAEAAAPPGLYEVVLTDIQPFSQADLQAIRDYFVQNGVDVKSVRYQLKGLHQLRIEYVKHAPSEAISQGALLIPLIPAMLLATIVGIAIFKIEDVGNAVAKVVVGVGVVVVMLALIFRQSGSKTILEERRNLLARGIVV